MSRKVDWSGSGYFNEGSSAGPLQRKFIELAAKEETMQKSNAELHALKPQLKKVLTWFMANKKQIQVVRPFQYQTEKFVKSQSGGGGFHSVNAVAQPGTVLNFVKLEKSTNQFIFEDATGEEVAIYSSDVLVGGRHGMNSVPNRGLMGLLYNTSIYETLVKLKEKEK